MTGKATNLALKLVVRHYELENVNHGVLIEIPVEVLGAQILFLWIRLKKSINIFNNLVYALCSVILKGRSIKAPLPPTYIRQNKANRDRVKLAFNELGNKFHCLPATIVNICCCFFLGGGEEKLYCKLLSNEKLAKKLALNSRGGRGGGKGLVNRPIMLRYSFLEEAV